MRVRTLLNTTLAAVSSILMTHSGWSYDRHSLDDPNSYKDYRVLYALGRVFAREEKWDLSASFLDKATRLNPTEGGRPVPLGGTEFDPYLPHYHLGVALYKVGSLESALTEWDESERQGFILNVKRSAKELRTYRKEVLDAFPQALAAMQIELKSIEAQVAPVASQSREVRDRLDAAHTALTSAQPNDPFASLNQARDQARAAFIAAEDQKKEAIRIAARDARESYDRAVKSLSDGRCSTEAIDELKSLLDRDIALGQGPKAAPKLRLAEASFQCGNLRDSRSYLNQAAAVDDGLLEERSRLRDVLDQAELELEVSQGYRSAQSLIAAGGCQTQALETLASLLERERAKRAAGKLGLSIEILMAKGYLGCQDLNRARQLLGAVPGSDMEARDLRAQLDSAQKRFDREKFLAEIFRSFDDANGLLATDGCQPEAIKRFEGVLRLGWPDEARAKRPGDSPLLQLAESNLRCGNLTEAQRNLDEEQKNRFASAERVASMGVRLRQAIAGWEHRRGTARAVSDYLAGRALSGLGHCEPNAIELMEGAAKRLDLDGTSVSTFLGDGKEYQPAMELALAHQHCGHAAQAKTYMEAFASAHHGEPTPTQQRLGAWLRRTAQIDELPKIALLVGMSDYSAGWDPETGTGWAPLADVKKNIRDVERVLRAQGFDVDVKENLKRSELEAVFDAFFKEKTRSGKTEIGRLVFYYGGHGWSERLSGGERLGYLVPVDTPAVTEASTPRIIGTYLVAMERFREYARAANARHAIFLFDSCFAGTVFDAIGTRIAQGRQEENLDAALAASSRIFITAGKEDQAVPAESRFAVAVTDGLNGMADSDSDGLVLGTEVASYVQTRGRTARSDPQWGYLSTNDRGGPLGNIAFLPVVSPAARAGSELTSAEKALKSELTAWESVLGTGDAGAIEQYLKNHDSAIFAGVAQAMLNGRPAS